MDIAGNRTIFVILLVLICVVAAPTQANLLSNFDFENGFYPWGTNDSYVAYDWTPFVLQGSPQYLRSIFERISGATCQQVWTDGVPFLAGIYQQAGGATPGAFYRLTAWTLTIWNGTGSPRADGHMKRKIGIDPYGGTNPTSPSIVWSELNSIDKQWKELTVTATAQSSTITAFFWLDDLDIGSQDQFYCDYAVLQAVAGVAIANVRATDVTDSTAVIRWTTNVPSTSRVDYGTTPDYGSSAYNAAMVTDHAVTLNGLTHATTYHYKVTSTASGYETGVSADYAFVTLRPPGIPISQAKAQPDGTVVTLNNKTVTAGNDLLSGVFYIEDEDRSSGIRVFTGTSGPTIATGSGVDVTGTLQTYAGERQINNATISTFPSTYAVPKPLSMLNISVGGGSLNAYTPGVYEGVGAHNTGLLVEVWGRVGQVDALSRLFYIEDGCGLWDGSGYPGLLVHCGSLANGNAITLPQPGDCVKVAGISSRRGVSGNYVAAIRPRQQTDITVVQPSP